MTVGAVHRANTLGVGVHFFVMRTWYTTSIAGMAVGTIDRVAVRVISIGLPHHTGGTTATHTRPG